MHSITPVDIVSFAWSLYSCRRGEVWFGPATNIHSSGCS